jgi:hypothetical protein
MTKTETAIGDSQGFEGFSSGSARALGPKAGLRRVMDRDGDHPKSHHR